MKTHEVLSLPEATLSKHLAQCKLKELERHAQKLIEKHCHGNYATTLRAVIKAVPSLSSNNDKFNHVKEVIHLHSHVPSGSAPISPSVLERTTVILMMIIAKKFEAIHSNANA